jgi:hypothetical protein
LIPFTGVNFVYKSTVKKFTPDDKLKLLDYTKFDTGKPKEIIEKVLVNMVQVIFFLV